MRLLHKTQVSDHPDISQPSAPAPPPAQLTLSRIKCNKSIPCDNCIRRGHPETCSRLPAIVRGRLVNAPNTTQRAPLTPEQIRLLREGQLQRENVNLRRRVAELETRLREFEGPAQTPTNDPGSVASRNSVPSPADSPSANAFAHLVGSSSSARQPHDEPGSRQDDPDVLEPFVHVMGVPAPPSDRRPSEPQGRPRLDSEAPLSPAVPGLGNLPDLPSRKATDLAHSDLLTLLPTAPQSMLIVRASLKFMSFLHATCHIPTFLNEHDTWIAKVTNGDEGGKGDAWLSYCESLPQDDG